jgi:hypothetical protein
MKITLKKKLLFSKQTGPIEYKYFAFNNIRCYDFTLYVKLKLKLKEKKEAK